MPRAHRAFLFSLYSILFCANAFAALEPAAVAVLSSGEVVVLDPVQGIFKISASGSTRVVSGFGVFQGADLVTAASDGGESFFVTQQIRFQSSDPFARLGRWTLGGKASGQWSLSQAGGVLAGVAIDPEHQIAYCSDSRSRTVYQVDLRRRDSPFTGRPTTAPSPTSSGRS